MPRRFVQPPLLPALALLWTLLLQGQTQNGNILGTVKDTTGAVIPQVALELEEQQTGFKRSVLSGEDGSFKLPDLPAGKYTITAWQEDYGAQTQDVTISGSETKTVDFTFKAKPY